MLIWLEAKHEMMYNILFGPTLSKKIFIIVKLRTNQLGIKVEISHVNVIKTCISVNDRLGNSACVTKKVLQAI